MSGFNSAAVREYLFELQDLIVTRLEQVDGKKFRRDSWDRPEGGGGRSCILEDGRTESILLSMPPLVKWRYDWHPEKGSAEAKLYEEFLMVKDWV